MATLTESFRSRRKDKQSLSEERARLSRQLEDSLLRLNELNMELIEAEKEMERDLRGWVQEGVERTALAECIPIVIGEIESGLERTRGDIEKDYITPKTKSILKARLPETERFLVWLRELSAFVSKPSPQFDESKLSPLPEGEQHGFVSSQKVREVLKNKS